jgi:hypothetical protein
VFGARKILFFAGCKIHRILRHKNVVFVGFVQNLDLPSSFSTILGSCTDHFMATGSFSNFKSSFNFSPNH